MPANAPPTRKSESVFSKSTLRLLLMMAILHVVVTTAVFVVGKRAWMPSQFDSNGLGSFASDGFTYQDEVMELAEILKTQGVRVWATWPTQLHVRIYSLPLVVLSRWTGFNVLAVEPVNLIYYLAILLLVLKIGETVIDRRTGILAAAIVGLWPSFLLHTTQLLRDPLLITVFLVFILGLTRCLKSGYRWQKGLIAGVLCAIAIVVIRIVRMPMWDVLWATALIATVLIVFKMLRNRGAWVGASLFLGLVFVTILVTPHFQASLRNQQRVKNRRVLLPEEVQTLPVQEQIARRREAFGLQVSKDGGVEPSAAGSDLNADVRFAMTTDMIRYFPRAVLVGFLAPFPNMWLAPGKQVGLSGRLLSGAESILTYCIECLAVIGLWNRRKNLSVWFLLLAASAGIVALGMVVSNIGAMYRLRYPFWILLVIVGAGGALDLFRRWSQRPSPMRS